MLIGYHNHFANPAGSWVSSAGLTAANLERLLSPHIAEPGVATLAAGDFEVRRRFSATPVPIQLVAVLGHLLAPDTGSVEIFLLNGLSDVWYSGFFDVQPNIIGFQNDIIFVLPAPVMATDILFQSGGSWDGPPSVGTFFASPIYRPPEGAKNDWSTYVKDLTQSRLTPGGQAYDSARQIVRVIESPGIDLLTQEQAYGSSSYTLPDLQQVAHIIGTTGRVMAIMREFDDAGNIDPHMIRRTSLYGQCPTGIKIMHRASGYYGTERITFEQRL